MRDMLSRTPGSSSITRIRAIRRPPSGRRGRVGYRAAVSLMPSPADTQIVRARVLPVLFLSAVLAGCAARPTTPAPRPPEETLRVETLERGVKEIRDVRLEDYVAASALSEFAPSAGDP